jgi:GDP-L-fucose synthase
MPSKFTLKGKSVWVAGETGMVGRAVIKRLEQENIDLLSAPHADLDLTHQQKTYNWLAENKPDIVIMAAAKVGGIGSNQADLAGFLYENLAMAQNVIHGSYLAGVNKLLYLGSSCVYPKAAAQPIKEESLLTGALEPTNEGYALAKIAGLKLCQFYRKQYGCDFIAAMPTNLYGPHDHFDPDESHVIPALMLKIHQAKVKNLSSVTLWGTGKPLREFLYVDDLANALIYLLKNYSDPAFINIGSGEEISIHDLATLISGVTGYKGKINFDESYSNGISRKFLDSSKIKNLGWKVEINLKDGIKKTYQWFLENYN